jgi:hypothetical protein
MLTERRFGRPFEFSPAAPWPCLASDPHTTLASGDLGLMRCRISSRFAKTRDGTGQVLDAFFALFPHFCVAAAGCCAGAPRPVSAAVPTPGGV